MKSRPIVVIGAGPAGVAAGIQLLRYGLETLIFEKDSIGGLLRNANLIENYPGFPGGISGLELVSLLRKQAEEAHLPICYERVLQLDYQQRHFRIQTTRDEYTADIVIVASGTKPKPISLSNITPEAQVRIYYEVFPLRQVFGKHILILGAGDAAFDYALNLSRTNQVEILNRGENLRCLPLLWIRSCESPNIAYHANTMVSHIDLDDAGRLQVDCRKPEGRISFRADFLLVAFGRDPCLDFISQPLSRITPQLQREGRLYFIGDVTNGIYRQTAIAVGNGVLAAMKINSHLLEMRS